VSTSPVATLLCEIQKVIFNNTTSTYVVLIICVISARHCACARVKPLHRETPHFTSPHIVSQQSWYKSSRLPHLGHDARACFQYQSAIWTS